MAAALGGLDPRQLDPALAGLVDSGDPFGGDLPGMDRPRAEDVLRPRRDDVVTYRVRVNLDDVDPPVWRRLELASDTGLATLHEVLQAAMGWTDSHLHRFAVGAPVFSRGALELLAPFDVSEGNPGTAEADVRLDEVMAEVGDRLHYAYDFGDGWEHTLRLEAVLPRSNDVPTARCTAGGRDGHVRVPPAAGPGGRRRRDADLGRIPAPGRREPAHRGDRPAASLDLQQQA